MGHAVPAKRENLLLIYRLERGRSSSVLCIVAYSDWHSSVGPEGNDYIYYDKHQIWLPPAISLTAWKLVVSFPQKCENARERNPPCI